MTAPLLVPSVHRCKANGCTEKLISESEFVTGFCFHCGDGEYHADNEDAPRRTPEWNAYIGDRP